MFIKMYDTLINSTHILRVHPPFTRTVNREGNVEWVIQMELVVPQVVVSARGTHAGGTTIETREYSYLTETEAREVMKALEDSLLNTPTKGH